MAGWATGADRKARLERPAARASAATKRRTRAQPGLRPGAAGLKGSDAHPGRPRAGSTNASAGRADHHAGHDRHQCVMRSTPYGRDAVPARRQGRESAVPVASGRRQHLRLPIIARLGGVAKLLMKNRIRPLREPSPRVPMRNFAVHSFPAKMSSASESSSLFAGSQSGICLVSKSKKRLLWLCSIRWHSSCRMTYSMQ